MKIIFNILIISQLPLKWYHMYLMYFQDAAFIQSQYNNVIRNLNNFLWWSKSCSSLSTQRLKVVWFLWCVIILIQYYHYHCLANLVLVYGTKQTSLHIVNNSLSYNQTIYSYIIHKTTHKTTKFWISRCQYIQFCINGILLLIIQCLSLETKLAFASKVEYAFHLR